MANGPHIFQTLLVKVAYCIELLPGASWGQIQPQLLSMIPNAAPFRYCTAIQYLFGTVWRRGLPGTFQFLLYQVKSSRRGHLVHLKARNPPLRRWGSLLQRSPDPELMRMRLTALSSITPSQFSAFQASGFSPYPRCMLLGPIHFSQFIP